MTSRNPWGAVALVFGRAADRAAAGDGFGRCRAWAVRRGRPIVAEVFLPADDEDAQRSALRELRERLSELVEPVAVVHSMVPPADLASLEPPDLPIDGAVFESATSSDHPSHAIVNLTSRADRAALSGVTTWLELRPSGRWKWIAVDHETAVRLDVDPRPGQWGILVTRPDDERLWREVLRAVWRWLDAGFILGMGYPPDLASVLDRRASPSDEPRATNPRLRKRYQLLDPDTAPVAGPPQRAGLSKPAAGFGQGPPGEIPVARRDEPLPHDGLFIRRNNAFGTRSTLGIRDLIEQGVIIDQTQIRFDDFLAAPRDDVPAPPPGAAIAVSHGTAAMPKGLTAHDATTHVLEIALRAGAEPAGTQVRAGTLPVNFVFVVDTSGSMAGGKLDLVKTAIRELHAQLRDGDFLGIVTFDTQVRTVLPATRKSALGVDELSEIVGVLRPGGGTDLNLGLKFGIAELDRNAMVGGATVNRLYLFSDGSPTSGEIDWIKIRKNVAEELRAALTISCFGFGSDVRMHELEALAGLAGGHATFVTDPDDVRLDLAGDLTRRDHLAGINVQLQIEIDPDVTIWHLYGHDLVTDPATRAAVEADAAAARRLAKERYDAESAPDVITDEKGIRIFAPDLAYGETYWVVLELQVPPGERAGLGTAVVQYVDTLTRSAQRTRLTLTPDGAIPAETAIVHSVGLWTSEVTFYAIDDLYEKDRETAQKRLNRHAKVLAAAAEAVPAPQFNADRITLLKFASLAGNLGLPRSWTDHRQGGPAQDMTYGLSAFGRVRSGFHRV